PPPQAREARLGFQEPHRRGLAESDDEPRRDEVDLPVEERRAGRGFLGTGRAVAGRAAFHHVRDVGFAPALEPDRGKHAVGDPPRLADEGLALLVLVRARALADKKPWRAFVADAEDRLLALLAQPAGRANTHRFL